jgi:hypothetical protein
MRITNIYCRPTSRYFDVDVFYCDFYKESVIVYFIALIDFIILGNGIKL